MKKEKVYTERDMKAAFQAGLDYEYFRRETAFSEILYPKFRTWFSKFNKQFKNK